MTAIEYILDGLEAELALERELGVRLVEVDRELLKVAPTSAAQPWKHLVVSPRDFANAQPISASPAKPIYDFVFLHHVALTDEASEMMTKIMVAMGKTIETAPILVEGPLPLAKYYVVLGAKALAKFFPGIKGMPGQTYVTAEGRRLLVTYSPHYLLRFHEVTPAVKKLKQDMWLSLKVLMQHIRNGN